METQILRTKSRHGISEKKKAQLDALTLSVLDAKHEVEQFQAIVTALTEKSNNFQAFLMTADNTRAQALSNKNLVEQLAQSALDLKKNSEIAFDEIVLANSKTDKLSTQVKSVMDKLIFAAEVINKLATLVIRKKAMNPLILDDLVSMINKAGTNANNAVALMLVALKSTFAAQASNMETEAATALEYTQATSLYLVLAGTDIEGNPDKKNSEKCILHLLIQAYENAKANYQELQIANNFITKQLNEATANLDKAQIKLKSLELGLQAGTAAALAS